MTTDCFSATQNTLYVRYISNCWARSLFNGSRTLTEVEHDCEIFSHKVTKQCNKVFQETAGALDVSAFRALWTLKEMKLSYSRTKAIKCIPNNPYSVNIWLAKSTFETGWDPIRND